MSPSKPFIERPMASSQKLNVQPPKANPPVGSSSGAPGACMTPSSETKVDAMSFLMGRLRGLEVSDQPAVAIGSPAN